MHLLFAGEEGDCHEDMTSKWQDEEPGWDYVDCVGTYIR